MSSSFGERERFSLIPFFMFSLNLDFIWTSSSIDSWLASLEDESQFIIFLGCLSNVEGKCQKGNLNKTKNIDTLTQPLKYDYGLNSQTQMNWRHACLVAFRWKRKTKNISWMSVWLVNTPFRRLFTKSKIIKITSFIWPFNSRCLLKDEKNGSSVDCELEIRQQEESS